MCVWNRLGEKDRDRNSESDWREYTSHSGGEHKVHLIYMLKPCALFAWQDAESSLSSALLIPVYVTSYTNCVLTVILGCGSALFCQSWCDFPLFPSMRIILFRWDKRLIFHINASGKLVWGPGMENGHDSPYLWVNWVMWLANTNGRKTTGILFGPLRAAAADKS